MHLPTLLLGLGALACAGTALAQPSSAPSQSATAATPDAAALKSAQAAIAAAPPVDLLISYHSRTIGKDGVTREASWSQRMHRRQGLVWLEREMPEALRRSQAHGHDHAADHAHAGHAHDDAQNAPLLVTRDAQGQDRVRTILREKRRVIEVDPAHHGNVGYTGDWDASYWIVSPRMLQTLQAQGQPKAGVQHLRQQNGENITTVEWDVAGQFPRRLERRDAHGTHVYRLSARRIQTPGTPPWQGLDAYEQGDYSDLLD